jgi:sucrose-6-phosphate hydrolase SacC (GH32 family)
MRWEKIGKIFDPTQHKLPSDCFDYAQAPQTLVFEDFIRIYFSTRAIDKNNGKYLSHIAFIDIKKNLHDIIRVSNKTVIPLGKLGCFDEHGIFPMSVVRRYNDIYGYICGWSRRVSVSVDTAIGLAISKDDGLTFHHIGDGPVLTASMREPFLVGDGFVRIIGGVFHMWYIFGTNWRRFSADTQPERTYKISHAVSTDGINWVKEEAIPVINNRLGVDESQATPMVIEIAGMYHMFFCYRQSFDFRKNTDRSYRIGHAFSTDLVNWTRDDDDPFIGVTQGDWDSDMLCYPHVFECEGNIYLLYNGNEFGRYGFGAALLVR